MNCYSENVKVDCNSGANMKCVVQTTGRSVNEVCKDTKVQIIFKGCNTIKSLLMHHPKEKIPHLHKNIVYQWIGPENMQFFTDWRIQ